MRVIVRAVADATFRMNLVISPDKGVTTVVANQVASSVVNEDGSATGFVNAAEIDTVVPYAYRIDIYPIGVGAMTIAGEVREYN